MNEDIYPGNGKKKQIIIWSIVGGIVVLGLLILAGTYSGLLGARLAPGLPFNINGPDELVAGQPAIVSWDTSPENQQQYPSEKIEFCRGRFFGERCVTLNADTTNDGEALVFVPNVSPGSGFLRLTARNRPGGDLLPRASMTRPVRVVAGNRTAQRSVIAPANVGGGSISTLTAAGPRVGVERGGTYTVILPEPSATKKIEVCAQGGRCYAVASSVRGASAQIRIPNIPVSTRAYLKVSERGPDGLLTGREFFRRALLIAAARPRPVAQQDDGGDGGGGGGGGGGGSSDDGGGDSNQQPTPTPQVAAEFVVPVDDEQLAANSDLDVRVQLTEITGTGLGCQQWKLNGQIITVNDWEGGQSPDLSAESCN